MTRYSKYFMIFSACLLLGCTESHLQDDDRYGYLSVGVSDELKDIVQVKSDSGETESEGAETTGPEIDGSQTETPDVEEDPIVYRIEVYDSENNLAGQVEDHRTTGEEPIPLLMGKYTVKAIYGQLGTGFNIPCLMGENSVRIYADQPASVNINAKMRKVKFSVAFPEDEEFKKKFSLYEVAVKAGNDVLTFSSSPDQNNDRIGSFADTAYFEVPSDKKLIYTLTMKNIDGAQYTASNVIEQVAVAEHYHFEFSLGEREDIGGALVLNVLLDGEYKTTFNHKINLNFDKQQMPSYSHNIEFDPVPEDGSIPVYPLGNDITKKFTFNAPRGIRNLIISHLDANLLTEGLPQLTDLVGISEEEKSILNAIGITADPVTEGATTAEIDITEFIKNLRITPDNETYMMSVTVIDKFDRYARCDFEFTIVSDIQAETVSATPWSSFAILKGRFFSRTAPSGITFQYKKKADPDTAWIEIDDEMNVDLTTLTYSYRLKGLELDTEYEYRATSDKDKQDHKVATSSSFKTYRTEGTIYNLSFDDWVKVGKAWYATNNSNDVNTGLIWDSANEGTSDILGQSLVPTVPEETIVIEGKAARMESGELLGNFAAGNLYTGDFGSATISPVGAKLKWGVPFTSRPLALKGWYRYEPEKINRTSSSYSHLSGQDDFCQIQIFLTTWKEQFEISTGDNRFVDTSTANKEIVAFGGIISQDNTTDNEGNRDGYIPFLIPLEYRSLVEPTYIVISCAASRYGDYFTGGLGSTLYVDEFELIYDPDELTDEEFELVMRGAK